MQTLPELSKWRQRLWPIYSHELKKFIPMVMILFWILFNYTTVRNIKDSIMVNAPHSSSGVLPWAKLLIVTPASILFVLFYAKLSNALSKANLYYTCLSIFIAFFFCFAFIIYPHKEFFHAAPETVLAWKQSVPVLIQDLCPMVGYWSFTLFYAMAELWGNAAVALLFWQFANQITPTTEAKRFYPIFGFWSNLGLVLSGNLAKYAGKMGSYMSSTGVSHYGVELKILCGCVTLGGIIIGLSYWWMEKYVLTDPQYYDEASLMKKGKEKKPKLPLGESIKFLMKSSYLGYITVLVLSYGMVINLIEVSWKDTIRMYYNNDTSAYGAFMGTVFSSTGIITMVLILLSQNIVRSMGWKFAASVTPWVSLITGGLFFAFLIFKDQMGGICGLINIDPVQAAIWLGLAQNCTNKGAKYALFDPTKEMAYIPLDEESKIKGKAAIDVVGSRAGKSGGSIINIALKPLGNMFFVAIGTVVAGICVWWLWAVDKLSKAYAEKVGEAEKTKPKSRS